MILLIYIQTQDLLHQIAVQIEVSLEQGTAKYRNFRRFEYLVPLARLGVGVHHYLVQGKLLVGLEG